MEFLDGLPLAVIFGDRAYFELYNFDQLKRQKNIIKIS